MGKTVWILGSGFSKPLGGPLLRDLFRQEYPAEIEPFFPNSEYPELSRTMPWVQRYFHVGVEQRLWENAEQFLAYVDDGFRGSAAARRDRITTLVQVTQMPMPEGRAIGDLQTERVRGLIFGALDKIVRRALAAECHRFLLDADPQSEGWLPYREWVKTLQPDVDTVLSFNYDRVVEMAADAAGIKSGVWIGMPEKTPAGTNLLQEQPGGTVPVLKLHGSVDWRLIEDPELGQSRLDPNPVDVSRILKSSTDSIGIAAPGGSKARFVARYLDPLWKRAEAALREAERLMVVGYSFPDTDPSAQHRLLGAFGNGDPRLRWANVVMGAEVTATSRRMLSLLRSTGAGRQVLISEWPESTPAGSAKGVLRIIHYPLGAQDFIGRHEALRALAVSGMV